MDGQVKNRAARARLAGFHPAALALALFGGAAAYAASAPSPAFEVFWHDRGTHLLEWRTFDADSKPLNVIATHSPPIVPPSAIAADDPIWRRKVPLGSLWELFVYLWLIETGKDAPDYVCAGAQGNSAAARTRRAEEAYCCNPGGRIQKDAALVRSCGLFFAPERLGIKAADWQKFWSSRSAGADWLPDLAQMRPQTQVTPASLINALSQIPAATREQAASVLLARAFDAHGGTDALVRHMGGQLRIKTFSWFLADNQTRYGGGAGWLGDGRPVWFAANGTGQQVMARYGKLLADTLLMEDWASARAFASSSTSAAAAPGCVRVRFFAHYPLSSVEKSGGAPASIGALRGRYVARFANKASLPFRANGELTLAMEKDQPRIEGQFALDDYVARVLDREADANEREAARALSVVIRTYLLREARRQGNCLVIDDSSRKQRVSPNPASRAAQAVAQFTRELVLRGAPVGYHRDTPGENRMAWKAAVAASRAETPWDIILRDAFPQASLAAMYDPAGIACKRFTMAERWLAARLPRWNARLQQALPGFEAPAAPQICLLSQGTPFSEQDRDRIHLRALKSAEDHRTLAHEYLHLGLKHHPAGHDEALVKAWARRLLNPTGEMPP
ncbi:MAG: DUF2300 domain-containing protein [Zoogloeaceae bacterium]|jgi:uncharacterized protein YfaQ (DUF2300 family)|nr:DUF2300 domain-containing protein [Zoogloeaceae bacterium]